MLRGGCWSLGGDHLLELGPELSDGAGGVDVQPSAVGSDLQPQVAWAERGVVPVLPHLQEAEQYYVGDVVGPHLAHHVQPKREPFSVPPGGDGLALGDVPQLGPVSCEQGGGGDLVISATLRGGQYHVPCADVLNGRYQTVRGHPAQFAQDKLLDGRIVDAP